MLNFSADIDRCSNVRNINPVVMENLKMELNWYFQKVISVPRWRTVTPRNCQWVPHLLFQIKTTTSSSITTEKQMMDVQVAFLHQVLNPEMTWTGGKAAAALRRDIQPVLFAKTTSKLARSRSTNGTVLIANVHVNCVMKLGWKETTTLNKLL